jgi:hypothetical protein
MSKEITINGLTDKQVAMLDIMWGLGSQEEFNDWVATLSTDDRELAEQLYWLLLIEIAESDTDEDYTEANEVLKAFMLNKKE